MSQRDISSLVEAGKSYPARTRQPGTSESVAKSRSPSVTNVAEPPITSTRVDFLGIRISSRITIPSDTHDICWVVSASILRVVKE